MRSPSNQEYFKRCRHLWSAKTGARRYDVMVSCFIERIGRFVSLPSIEQAMGMIQESGMR